MLTVLCFLDCSFGGFREKNWEGGRGSTSVRFVDVVVFCTFGKGGWVEQKNWVKKSIWMQIPNGR